MSAKTEFAGFPRECVGFFSELAQNNTREWFQDHKDLFERHVMAPARDFVFEMGQVLREIAPKIVADPRLDRSIFRHYRDTRFSKDKTPYKTHLGIFFWEGNRAKMECPGYYFHLEPPEVYIGAGIHCFSKPLLEQFRESVVHEEYGPALRQAVDAVKRVPGMEIGTLHFKKTPRGYDPKHQNAEFLLLNGLTAGLSEALPKELYSREILDYCFAKFKDVQPVHSWLVDMIGRVA